MGDVVRLEIRGCRETVARGQVFQQFDAGSGSSTKRGDAQSRGKDVVQMFLFGVEVLARADDGQAKQIAIQRQRAIRIGDDDGGMVEAEEEAVGAMPSLV